MGQQVKAETVEPRLVLRCGVTGGHGAVANWTALEQDNVAVLLVGDPPPQIDAQVQIAREVAAQVVA